jgi:hypothetical protein
VSGSILVAPAVSVAAVRSLVAGVDFESELPMSYGSPFLVFPNSPLMGSVPSPPALGRCSARVEEVLLSVPSLVVPVMGEVLFSSVVAGVSPQMAREAAAVRLDTVSILVFMMVIQVDRFSSVCVYL